MTKFEIIKTTTESRFNLKEVKEGFTLSDECPEVLESFDNIAAARVALQKYKSSASVFSNCGMRFIAATEFSIQENEYDEDGDLENSGDIWESAPFDKDDLLKFMNHKIEFSTENSDEIETIVLDPMQSFTDWIFDNIDRDNFYYNIISEEEVEIVNLAGEHVNTYRVVKIEPTTENTDF